MGPFGVTLADAAQLVSGRITPLRRDDAMKRKRYSTEQIVAALK
jgi:hypothetical protein